MEAQSIQFVDTMFTCIFITAAVIGIVYFMHVSLSLSTERHHMNIQNCVFRRGQVAAFFALMLIPAGFFYSYGMLKCSVATIGLSLTLSCSVIMLSRRAGAILRRLGYR